MALVLTQIKPQGTSIVFKRFSDWRQRPLTFFQLFEGLCSSFDLADFKRYPIIVIHPSALT